MSPENYAKYKEEWRQRNYPILPQKPKDKCFNGDPKVLGTFRDRAAKLWGEGSRAVRWMDGVIAKAPEGREEPLFIGEGQIVSLLIRIEDTDPEKQ